MMGFSFDLAVNQASATAGHRIFANNTTENLTFEYAVPLIGILGANNDKMIPVGKILGMRLELTLDAIVNFIATTTLYSTTQYQLTEVEFVGNYVTLGPESQALVDKLNPDKIYIRAQSWKQTSATLNAGISGSNEVTCNIRVNSLKSIYVAANVITANEKKFSGINPNLTSGSGWSMSGQMYPQRGIDPSNRPADCFAELQRSFGALNMVNYNSYISKSDYYVSNSSYGLMYVYQSNLANIMSQSNQCFMGVDTEVVQRKASLLSGISTYSTGLMFRANIGSVLAVAQTLNFFGFYDLILEVDCITKNIVAKY